MNKKARIRLQLNNQKHVIVLYDMRLDACIEGARFPHAKSYPYIDNKQPHRELAYYEAPGGLALLEVGSITIYDTGAFSTYGMKIDNTWNMTC